jgi:hypothetical protein
MLGVVLREEDDTVGRKAWLAALVAVTVTSSIAIGSPAAARATEFIAIAGSNLDPGVGLASNLNTSLVAALDRPSGRVVVRNLAGGPWTDRGVPSAVRVRQLAVSAQEVYAVDAAGSAFQFDRAAGRWLSVGADVAELLASRDGVDIPGNPPVFAPFLYKVDAAGGIWRRAGQSWSLIGSGAAAGSLAERGPRGRTRLYELAAARTEILEWTGTSAVWTTVGGPAASIAAGLDAVALVESDGTPRFYTGTPFEWVKLATPAGRLVPTAEVFGPGGRVSFGILTMYYRTASRHVWGVRWPEALPGPVAMPWWHLTGPSVAIAPHLPIRELHAAVMRPDGFTSELSWGEMRRAPAGVSRPNMTEGEAYFDASVDIDDWNGQLGVVLLGDIPPGILAAVDPHQRIVLYGRPTRAGRFTFVERVFDSAGPVLDIPVFVEVGLPGTGPPVDRTNTVVTTSLELTNCLASRSPMTVWWRDTSAGGVWAEVPGSPVASALDSAGGCTGSVSLTATPPSNHLVEIVAVDPAATHCGGLNDPQVQSCVRSRTWAVGGAMGTRLQTSVTG